MNKGEKKMMKNKFLFTMLLIFTVLLTACGGGNGDTAKTGNAAMKSG